MRSGEVVAERYRVERELGRGGMGAVYLARDLRRERDVALKVVSASGHAQEEARARFEREAAIGCALGQERGFVRCFDWGELSHGRLYLAMDLVRDARPLELRAGSLQERLERLEHAARLVARAQALGVVHRDLKPANFLVDPAGAVWLTDFGLAKLEGEALDPAAGEAPLLTRTGMAMGTPTFMPPEQFEDAKSAGAPADVWALGVMLFHLLTGRFPYEGRTPTEVMTLQIKTRLGERRALRAAHLESAVPPALDALCAEALELDPARRLRSAQEFLARLEAARRDPRGAGVQPSLATFAAPRPTPSPATTPSTPTGAGVAGSLLSQAPRPATTPLPARPFATDWGYELGRSLKLGLPLLVLVGLATLLQVTRMAMFAGPRGAGDPIEMAPARLGPVRTSVAPPGELGAVWQAANRGELEAMLEVADRYRHGDGVTRDVLEAARWYQAAADRGDADAMVALGELYLNGDGVEQSDSMARSWFQRAARAGSNDGEMYLISLEQQEQAEREAREEELRARMLERSERRRGRGR